MTLILVSILSLSLPLPSSLSSFSHSLLKLLLSYYIGEWRAPLGKEALRPEPIGTFAFTKFDHQRAIMFGGSGSKGRVNEVYIFHLDDRVDIIALTLFMVQLTVFFVFSIKFFQ